jgi:hypothetical protein
MARTDQPGTRVDHLPPTNPEVHLAACAVKSCAVLAVPVLGCAWLAASWPGVLGVAIAVLLVSGLLLVQAAVLALCAPRSGVLLVVGGYAGFVIRLAITAAVLTTLRPLEGLHMPSLVIATIVLMSTALICESWHACHAPGFFWVNPRPAQARGRKQSERIPA